MMLIPWRGPSRLPAGRAACGRRPPGRLQTRLRCPRPRTARILCGSAAGARVGVCSRTRPRPQWRSRHAAARTPGGALRPRRIAIGARACALPHARAHARA
eukprot:9037620-Alexandrium_andersonii.AAC.1